MGENWKEAWRLTRSLWGDVSNPSFRPLLVIVVVTVSIGSLFYWRVEHRTMLDSVYFSVMTLSTVGYGDISPKTALGKIFTIFYVLVGLGLFGVFVNAISRRSMRESEIMRRLTEELQLAPDQQDGQAEEP